MLYPTRSHDTQEDVLPLSATHALPKQAVVTIGGSEHFSIRDIQESSRFACEMAKEVAQVLGVSPDSIFGIARDGDISSLPRRFIEQFLLPRLSRAGAEGKLQAFPLEEALQLARITLVTHSFGERLARDIGKELVDALQDQKRFEKPYTEPQVQKLTKQILVLGLGGALDYDLLNMGEGGGAYERPASPLNHVSLYGENEESIRGVARVYPESFLLPVRSHNAGDYLKSISSHPQLQEALQALVQSPALADDASTSLDGMLPRTQVLNERSESL